MSEALVTTDKNLLPQGLKEALETAREIAKSGIVPRSFQSPGAVYIALDMAHRLNMSLMMVMQNLYVVHGQPAWAGKFCKALIDRAPDSDGRPRYVRTEYELKHDSKGEVIACRLVATARDGRTVYGTWVTWEIVVAEGWNKDKQNKDGGITKSKWNTIREQMFKYRAAAFFQRTECPDSSLGLPLLEEAEEMEADREAKTFKAPKPAAPEGGVIEAEIVDDASPKVMAEYAAIEQAIQDAKSRDDLSTLVARIKMLPKVEQDALRDLWKMRREQLPAAA